MNEPENDSNIPPMWFSMGFDINDWQKVSENPPDEFRIRKTECKWIVEGFVCGYAVLSKTFPDGKSAGRAAVAGRLTQPYD